MTAPLPPSVPDATLVEVCLLFFLFLLIVACLAEGLQVGLIPEEAFITTMRLDVVAHQESGVDFDTSTAWILAGEQVTKEGAEPKRLPTCSIIPCVPWWLPTGI